MEYTDKEWMELANRARELDALYRSETKRKILELEIKALSLEITELWDIKRLITWDETIREAAEAMALLTIREKDKKNEELTAVEKTCAIQEWLNHHRKGEEWEPITGCWTEIHGRRLPVVVLYNENDDYPYSVQYAGDGKYFKTYEKAKAYIVERFRVYPIITAAVLDKLKHLGDEDA